MRERQVAAIPDRDSGHEPILSAIFRRMFSRACLLRAVIRAHAAPVPTAGSSALVKTGLGVDLVSCCTLLHLDSRLVCCRRLSACENDVVSAQRSPTLHSATYAHNSPDPKCDPVSQLC